MENKWRDRYYELERTLENIIRGVQFEMEKLEADSGTASSDVFRLSKVTKSNALGSEFIHCVASGINLEYSFEFLKSDNPVHTVPFQRSNSVPVCLGVEAGATHCMVVVRENTGEHSKSVVKRKIAL